MSVRPPNLSSLSRGKTGLAVLDYEVMQERASALGEAGRMLEKALLDLKTHDAESVAEDDPDQRKRAGLVQKAADAAWALFIQHELSGLSSQRILVKRYRIPGEVLARVGIRTKS
ncbi:hypothetical protein K1W69_12465 [Hoeflea sp. WL0058]|uniref:Uncharacterized protein n=1 Tax=Flavimaribacter sediminis TaxID=2865987 RepID=A0AAE3D1Z8_9HYPH|nr:DUF6665 family protein [Flavimaribacter sediminis]MBW8638003.1 hypothetical protein [Flavimaribacter sediminis]